MKASLGAVEDGIMSPELLERLLDEPGTGKVVAEVSECGCRGDLGSEINSINQ